MKITFTITQALIEDIRSDLVRPHPFGAERVGFILARFGRSANGALLVLAHQYLPMADAFYVQDYRYGALLGAEGFSKAFGIAYLSQIGLFHVHLHQHTGRPGFSGIDEAEMSKFVPDFFNVRPNLPHGSLVLSSDSISGRCWLGAKSRGALISHHRVVGAPCKRFAEKG